MWILLNLEADVTNEQIVQILSSQFADALPSNISRIESVMQINEDLSLVFSIDMDCIDGSHWEAFLHYNGTWTGSHLSREIAI